MKDITYLDNSATTKPCDEAVALMIESLKENWGNPSSLHSLGIKAEETTFACRSACAKTLSCREDEIYFTSGGTEANNIAIKGAVSSRAKRGNRIVTTAIEHPSVLQTIRQFEEKGFDVVYLKPKADGKISIDDLADAINEKTILVSIMLVNNETGAIQPVSAAADIIKKVGCPALLHCDAVQGFGKMNIKVDSFGVDLLTASGHKIHGPKGIGLLYKKKGVHISSLTHGGGQQENLRPGTEPMPLIAGLKGAIDALPVIDKQNENMKALWSYAKESLKNTGLVKINSADDVLPFILNISVPGWRSETLLHFLDADGVYVSSGSACAKGELSYTLKALGLNAKEIDSALRISFSRYNTKADIDRLCNSLIKATNKLKKV